MIGPRPTAPEAGMIAACIILAFAIGGALAKVFA